MKWRRNLRSILLAALIASGLAPAVQAAPGEVLRVESSFFGRTLTLRLNLAEAVPYRVFTLDDPRRLIVEVAAEGWLEPALLGRAWPRAIGGIRAGASHDGWVRLAVDLGKPLALETAQLRRTAEGAEIDIRLRRGSAAEFAAASGAPPDVWPFGAARAGGGAGRVSIAIDPGHGGVDPGATAGGVAEKDVMLDFAQALRDRLAARGRYEVFLTREADEFVALDERVRRARAAEADLLLSLHANAEADETVGGAIVFTRSERSSSALAAGRVAFENAAGLAAGDAGPPPAEEILLVLSDMARRNAARRSEEAAAALVDAIERDLGTAGTFPRQSGRFAVLAAPEMPSVLLELGFLSNMRDRQNLTSPGWRIRAAEAVAVAIDAWAVADGPRAASQ
ncbi:MAG TPA: N-acetylmuramoyl-L-alanine amidase [Amaricoccus sp.]|uniref:N-acetylmuramoyl-L-alanine amidase n=1 Tax=Amaricoccus sp. TaxID=1872485 RepID=UPI002BD490E3|nr:N-acetylmuramoyl-L-alanine amidase [Amaricoccus sp.]HMQ94569.1 N-acetylmuramoyl-L-alanine amidase [Amaricoccus sp.]HMR52968.1 N-acetylmuramoyl-L-alanine amidase [Amaricoccus sp.]HMR60982.1 N-acetylmuramoyl-L-alanine amidase [Amaricoccus sp.]HMT99887.1 N-acetylmuramoyl-L-alanine amidase [Amaricoccus sp.]